MWRSHERGQLHDVTLGYARHRRVHHLAGDFGHGRLTAVVGPNGSGKSTLLKGLAGDIPPLSGEIRMNGLKPGDIAYLPQDPRIERSFPMTLHDLVSLGFWGKRGFFRKVTADDRHRLEEAFAAVGLEGFEDRDGVGPAAQCRALFASCCCRRRRSCRRAVHARTRTAPTSSSWAALAARGAHGVVLHALTWSRPGPETLLLALEKGAGADDETLRPRTCCSPAAVGAWATTAHCHRETVYARSRRDDTEALRGPATRDARPGRAAALAGRPGVLLIARRMSLIGDGRSHGSAAGPSPPDRRARPSALTAGPWPRPDRPPVEPSGPQRRLPEDAPSPCLPQALPSAC